MPCAGILCPHPELKRFHFTCLYCRWRREYLGRWTRPSKWFTCCIPWLTNERRFAKLMIDPRGHMLMFRIVAIVGIIKTASHFPRRYRRKLVNLCELLANLTW